MVSDSDVITLHRYYIWANKMRTDFDDVLRKYSEKKISKKQYDIETHLYMSYWYGGLYVVIEGWKQLKLEDNKIDSLLGSSNVELLRRYRNGVFHFQKQYNDERFEAFYREGKDTVKWIRSLNLEFGRFFLNWCKNRKSSA